MPKEHAAQSSKQEEIVEERNEVPSEWQKMFENAYGDKNKFEAVAKVNASAKTTLFPTKYDDIPVDNKLANAIEVIKIEKKSSAKANDGKPIIYINDGKDVKILVCDKQIGSGNEGVIWRAQDTQTKKWYAVKIEKGPNVSSSVQREETEKYLRKIQILGDEGKIVLIDNKIQGKIQSNKAIPLNLVEGYSLEKYIMEKIVSRPNDKMNLGDLYECLCIFIELIEKVQKLHKQNRIHHDLKPSNIQIQPYTGEITLLDVDNAPKINQEHGALIETRAFSENYHWDREVHNVTPSYDVFSLGVLFLGMLRKFEFSHHESHLFLKKEDLSSEFNPDNYDPASVDIIKQLIVYIQKMIVKEPSQRPSLEIVKQELKTKAKQCYEELLKDRTQFKKVGIIYFYEMITKENGKLAIDPNVLPALRSLDGFYIYVESLDDQPKAQIEQLLVLCHDNNIPLRGIISDKKNQQSSSDKLPSRLPSHLNLPLDRVRDQIDQLEKPFSPATPRPLNIYFNVTNQQPDETTVRAIHAHSMGCLTATSLKTTSHYTNAARQQMKTLLVVDADYVGVINNLKENLNHFKKKFDKLKAKQDEMNKDQIEFKDKRELNIYALEVELTKSLLSKIAMQNANGQLTYQTLIHSLRAYRSNFLHSNSFKGFFCDFLGMEHSTKSAGEIKNLEKYLKISEAFRQKRG